LIVLQECLAQLAHCVARKQSFASGVLQRILDVAHREATGVHLHGQLPQYIAVAAQEAHQVRTIRPVAGPVSDLRYLDGDLTLIRAQSPWLVAISMTAQWFIRPAVLIMAATQLLGRFAFQQLLHDQLCTQLYPCADRVLLPGDPVVQQVVRLLAHLLALCYPLHGVWSFLPFRDGDLGVRHSVPHAA
jgi:hypothetical protein